MPIFFQLLFLLFAAPCLAATPLKVALLLEHEEPSAYTDLLKKGLADAGGEIETEIIIANGEKQREIFRKAAAEHDLVLVASDNLHEALRDNAANFRRTKFGSIDAGIRAPNIMSVTFADEQAAFLAGAAAAQSVGPGGAIGWLSGADTPAIRSLYNGYREGALLANPSCRIVQAVVGSFTDGQAAVAKARWLAESGAKIIAIAAGSASKACAEAVIAKGASVIALDAPIPGLKTFGAITKAADRAVREIVDSARDKFRGKEIVVYSLANGGTDFVPAFKNNDIARRMKELRHELLSGNTRLKSLRQRTLCDCLD